MMIVYSFFLHGSVMPRNRMFSVEKDVPSQLRTNAKVVDGLFSHIRSTLRRLQKATVLRDFDHSSREFFICVILQVLHEI
jgi:hypothetical protein